MKYLDIKNKKNFLLMKTKEHENFGITNVLPFSLGSLKNLIHLKVETKSVINSIFKYIEVAINNITIIHLYYGIIVILFIVTSIIVFQIFLEIEYLNTNIQLLTQSLIDINSGVLALDKKITNIELKLIEESLRIVQEGKSSNSHTTISDLLKDSICNEIIKNSARLATKYIKIFFGF
jgi:hypothetical protein